MLDIAVDRCSRFTLAVIGTIFTVQHIALLLLSLLIVKVSHNALWLQ